MNVIKRYHYKFDELLFVNNCDNIKNVVINKNKNKIVDIIFINENFNNLINCVIKLLNNLIILRKNNLLVI